LIWDLKTDEGTAAALCQSQIKNQKSKIKNQKSKISGDFRAKAS
jgi:hypothetical protein